jgi:hypothetical protein
MRYLILIILLSLSYFSIAQQKKIASIKIDDVVFATVDRPGELYLANSKGVIKKYSTNGDLLATSQPLNPTLFDPQDGARIFLYNNKKQSYLFLTPSLEERLPLFKIDSAYAISPKLISPSGDHNILILDSADWSLKRINTRTSSVILEINIGDQLKENSHVVHLREYQNFIFLHDANNGVLIFNSMGRFLKLLPPKIASYNFLGEELYYKEGNELKFFDLFTTETRSLPLPSPGEIALITDERIFIINQRKLEIFEFKLQ